MFLFDDVMIAEKSERLMVHAVQAVRAMIFAVRVVLKSNATSPNVAYHRF